MNVKKIICILSICCPNEMGIPKKVWLSEVVIVEKTTILIETI